MSSEIGNGRLKTALASSVQKGFTQYGKIKGFKVVDSKYEKKVDELFEIQPDQWKVEKVSNGTSRTYKEQVRKRENPIVLALKLLGTGFRTLFNYCKSPFLFFSGRRDNMVLSQKKTNSKSKKLSSSALTDLPRTSSLHRSKVLGEKRASSLSAVDKRIVDNVESVKDKEKDAEKKLLKEEVVLENKLDDFLFKDSEEIQNRETLERKTAVAKFRENEIKLSKREINLLYRRFGETKFWPKIESEIYAKGNDKSKSEIQRYGKNTRSSSLTQQGYKPQRRVSF